MCVTHCVCQSIGNPLVTDSAPSALIAQPAFAGTEADPPIITPSVAIPKFREPVLIKPIAVVGIVLPQKVEAIVSVLSVIAPVKLKPLFIPEPSTSSIKPASFNCVNASTLSAEPISPAKFPAPLVAL